MCFTSSQQCKWNQMFESAGVADKGSACLPSTLTILVRILLKSSSISHFGKVIIIIFQIKFEFWKKIDGQCSKPFWVKALLTFGNNSNFKLWNRKNGDYLWNSLNPGWRHCRGDRWRHLFDNFLILPFCFAHDWRRRGCDLNLICDLDYKHR